MEARTFADEVVALRPQLRAFAMSLAGSLDRAEDLVQETCVLAIANEHTFQPGTNLAAWLFTILRNRFYSEYRKRKREVADSDGSFAATLVAKETQLLRVEALDLLHAVESLPPHLCQAVMLVTIRGYTYDEAAALVGCAIGTMKSRINRARELLEKRLNAAPKRHLATELEKCLSDESAERPVPKPLYVFPPRARLPAPSVNKETVLLAGTNFVLAKTQRMSDGREARIFSAIG